MSEQIPDHLQDSSKEHRNTHADALTSLADKFALDSDGITFLDGVMRVAKELSGSAPDVATIWSCTGGFGTGQPAEPNTNYIEVQIERWECSYGHKLNIKVKPSKEVLPKYCACCYPSDGGDK